MYVCKDGSRCESLFIVAVPEVGLSTVFLHDGRKNKAINNIAIYLFIASAKITHFKKSYFCKYQWNYKKGGHIFMQSP
jgi:hypothetical protein